MADLGGVFNANDVQPASFDVLPAGEYEAVIVNSEMKATKDGLGKYLNLEIQILNGPYQNRKVFDKLNLVNNNAQAVQIARGTLSAICRAVNVMTPKDSSELHSRPLRIKVTVKKSDEFGEQNEVKAYKPRSTGPNTAPLFPNTAPISVAQPVSPAQPAAATADNGSPWG